MNQQEKEVLIVRDFLIIKRAEIEIKKFNVLIGPQANGKSLIAKLVYFFKRLNNDFISAIRANEVQKDIIEKISTEFESIFPRYSWEGTSFVIDYKFHSIDIKIEGRKNAKGKTTLKFSFSDTLIKIFTKKKKVYSKRINEFKLQKRQENLKIETRVTEASIFRDIIKELRDECKWFSPGGVFIPAARSFFANLQNNIFTFLASNLKLDPLLVEFGSLYENAKNIYTDSFFKYDEKKNALISGMVNSVIQGAYEFKDDKDWIVNRESRVNLSNASSGQQESLPMLLVLAVMLRTSFIGRSLCFIEEPEAHLFPTSQSTVISILSVLQAEMGATFFITTHSPYILTAINNLILADDAITEDKITKEEFHKLNGPGASICFDDVSAYTIHNGVSKDIKDDEYRMIGGEMLDEISEHFEKVMNVILEK